MLIEQPPVKKAWRSKTLWINAIAGLGAILALAGVDGASEFATKHGEAILLVMSVVNLVLRTVTKEKVGLSE